MSTQVKRRRGTAAENAAFTGAAGEIVVLTDSKRAAIHDAIRAGGYILPTADDLLNGAITSGTASGTNTYALTLPFFPTSYLAGLEIDVTFTNANTGSCTLNVNGVGAAGMKDETGTNFTSGQIAAGSRYTFRHNGTEWRRVSGAAGTIKNIVQQIFTASGTYTPTTGMVYCRVQLVGGGGGGGSPNGTTGGACAGGGAGGYAEKTFTAATIGASQTVTIGAAGAGGAAGNPGNTGGTGGTTSLGALLSATGGTGGGQVSGNSVGNANGGTGGVGSSGTLNLAGGTGGAAHNFTATGPRVSGMGGNSFFGGAGAYPGSGAGIAAAANSGSGGGGGRTDSGTFVTGGNGGAGLIIITEYRSQ